MKMAKILYWNAIGRHKLEVQKILLDHRIPIMLSFKTHLTGKKLISNKWLQIL